MEACNKKVEIGVGEKRRRGDGVMGGAPGWGDGGLGCRRGPARGCRYLDFSLKRRAAGGDGRPAVYGIQRITTTCSGLL